MAAFFSCCLLYSLSPSFALPGDVLITATSLGWQMSMVSILSLCWCSGKVETPDQTQVSETDLWMSPRGSTYTLKHLWLQISPLWSKYSSECLWPWWSVCHSRYTLQHPSLWIRPCQCLWSWIRPWHISVWNDLWRIYYEWKKLHQSSFFNYYYFVLRTSKQLWMWISPCHRKYTSEKAVAC